MPRFSLEVSPPVKGEQGWEVTALATVLYGNRAPDPPEEVVFNVNGDEFERTETNPESGIARSVMILQVGGYIVTAYRPRAANGDRDARRTRSFAIREEKGKLKIPKRLSVTISGERGRQKLLISVSAEDGFLIPGFTGMIQDPSGVVKFTTDANGMALHQVNFSEPSMPIEIRAGNHPDLVWRARILGPRPKGKE